MKKLIFGITAVLCATTLSAQKIPGTANVIEGKIVFIEANPAIQYRHVGTVECSAFSPDKFELMMKHMLVKRMAKEYPDVAFDALIFRPGSAFCKADVIQFYVDPKAKKKKNKKGEEIEVDPEFRKSETVGRNGINLFIENNPTVEYTLLGKVEIPTNFQSVDYEAIIKEMVRVATAAYPDLNGIVFTTGTDLRKANVIKLK